jgi:hypothetical protein
MKLPPTEEPVKMTIWLDDDPDQDHGLGRRFPTVKSAMDRMEELQRDGVRRSATSRPQRIGVCLIEFMDRAILVSRLMTQLETDTTVSYCNEVTPPKLKKETPLLKCDRCSFKGKPYEEIYFQEGGAIKTCEACML